MYLHFVRAPILCGRLSLRDDGLSNLVEEISREPILQVWHAFIQFTVKIARKSRMIRLEKLVVHTEKKYI
jgi:hypothetical protein